MTISRTHLAVGTAGLVAGLALGITGLANAVDPTPSPGAGREDTFRERMHDRPGMPGGRMGKHHRGGYGGLVSAIDSDSLTVRTPRGTETVSLTSSTSYYVGKTEASRSAVSRGDVVHVRLVDPQSTAKVAAVVTVAPAHLAGWVTAVGDSTLTITDVDGFTRTLRTSSATTYVKDGKTSTRSVLTVGAFVRANGQVNADGTTLDATKIATGLPHRNEGMSPGRMRPEDPTLRG